MVNTLSIAVMKDHHSVKKRCFKCGYGDRIWIAKYFPTFLFHLPTLSQNTSIGNVIVPLTPGSWDPYAVRRDNHPFNFTPAEVRNDFFISRCLWHNSLAFCFVSLDHWITQLSHSQSFVYNRIRQVFNILLFTNTDFITCFTVSWYDTNSK